MFLEIFADWKIYDMYQSFSRETEPLKLVKVKKNDLQLT